MDMEALSGNFNKFITIVHSNISSKKGRNYSNYKVKPAFVSINIKGEAVFSVNANKLMCLSINKDNYINLIKTNSEVLLHLTTKLRGFKVSIYVGSSMQFIIKSKELGLGKHKDKFWIEATDRKNFFRLTKIN